MNVAAYSDTAETLMRGRSVEVALDCNANPLKININLKFI